MGRSARGAWDLRHCYQDAASPILRLMHGNARTRDVPAGPWFSRHPVHAVVVATGLFVAIFILRLAVEGATEAIALLFTLPIALLALTFGFRVGTAAGVLGVLLLAVWAIVAGESLTPLAWLSQATPMLLLGALAGMASDGLRLASEGEQRLAVATVRTRDAAEINDSLIQKITAAKWSLELGNHEASIELLAQSIEAAEALVRDLLQGHDDQTTALSVGGHAISPTPYRSN